MDIEENFNLENTKMNLLSRSSVSCGKSSKENANILVKGNSSYIGAKKYRSGIMDPIANRNTLLSEPYSLYVRNIAFNQ